MNNIILIGMPGVGKSTVGVVLAKTLGYAFLDSDLLIQEREGLLLHEIIEKYGLERFNQIESEVNASIEAEDTVIATGGSVVYGTEAMMHLKALGTVVYLKLSYEELTERLGDLNKRGVSIRPGETLETLYEERIPIYERYADVTVDCEDLSIRDIVKKITYLFQKRNYNIEQQAANDRMKPSLDQFKQRQLLKIFAKVIPYRIYDPRRTNTAYKS